MEFQMRFPGEGGGAGEPARGATMTGPDDRATRETLIPARRLGPYESYTDRRRRGRRKPRSARDRIAGCIGPMRGGAKLMRVADRHIRWWQVGKCRQHGRQALAMARTVHQIRYQDDAGRKK